MKFVCVVVLLVLLAARGESAAMGLKARVGLTKLSPAIVVGAPHTREPHVDTSVYSYKPTIVSEPLDTKAPAVDHFGSYPAGAYSTELIQERSTASVSISQMLDAQIEKAKQEALASVMRQFDALKSQLHHRADQGGYDADLTVDWDVSPNQKPPAPAVDNTFRADQIRSDLSKAQAAAAEVEDDLRKAEMLRAIGY